MVNPKYADELAASLADILAALSGAPASEALLAACKRGDTVLNAARQEQSSEEIQAT